MSQPPVVNDQAETTMTQTVSLEIPDLIAKRYPSAAALKQALYADIVIRAFQKGELTLREGAALLNTTYEGFVVWLGERGVSFIAAGEDELRASSEQFEAFLQTYTNA